MSLDIILSNDDGYNAPGIQTLYDALVAAGENVHIVAPAENQSAQGSSLGGIGAISQPINVTEFSSGNYYVDGRPIVATKTALEDLFVDHTPDLVISGTNRGDNTGESANISGTVNAAVAGLLDGVPQSLSPLALMLTAITAQASPTPRSSPSICWTGLRRCRRLAHRCCHPARG